MLSSLRSLWIWTSACSRQSPYQIIMYHVGGLFNDETLELSIDAFNNTRDTGEGSGYYSKIFYPNVIDSYSTALQMCKNTSKGSVVALIDARPTKGECDYTCALCNRLNISHLSVGWQPVETQAEDLYTFSFYPPPEVISKAFATFINKELKWDQLTIFYEDEGSFIRLQEVINTWRLKDEPIVYRKLSPNIDNRETFKQVIKELHMNTHILDCELEHIPIYVDQIISVENSTQYQSFLLTNLDSHLYTLHDKNFTANVSTMHMTTKNDPKWRDSHIHPSLPIKMETALTADALNHLRKAITALSAVSYSEDGTANERENQFFENPPQICFAEKVSEYSDKAWPHGNDLREALLRTSVPKGFTENVEFDKNGRRTNVRLHFSKLTNTSEFVYTGYWDSMTDTVTKEDETVKDRSVTLQGVLVVATKKDPPYAYYTTYQNGTTSDLRGYAVDLIYKIFEYIEKNNGTKIVPDFRITSGIEAIIDDVMNHNADLGICDLTINSKRNKMVDFSIPFMATGIALMARVPDPEEPNMFSFVNPLTLDVWLYLATTYIFVSVVLLICARMSQDDWVNPHPCNQNPENLQNIWSLYNCMWLTMGTIMTQGCDILPRGIGSRWITGMWWFFAMIITASYTANMATVISASRRNDDIKEVKDLAEQNTISYGAAINSSTYNFFKNSNDSLHKKLWAAMESAKPTVFEGSNPEGKERVLNGKGKYAFFMESTAINYFVERDDNLRMVGSELDSKEYGIAMPKNSPVKHYVDSALLTLQENGFMSELRTKWWKKEDNSNYKGDEEEKKETDNKGSVKMEKTSGIFIVLGAGGILGLIVAVINFLMHAHEISVQEKVTFKEAILSEWRASLDPRLRKPVAPPRSAPPTPSPSLQRERSQSRAVSVLKAATSFINFDEIY